MKRPARALRAAVVVLAGVALLVGRAVLASDHLDGPRAIANPQADIADVFTFTSPEDPSRVVLAMTVFPYAPGADAAAPASFSAQIDYVFRVRRVVALSPFTLDDAVLDVTCDFDTGTPQQVTCVAPNGLQASAAVGEVAGPDGGPASPMRVFAGLRSDPAFFDRQGALATVATGRASFTGQNAFGGANVLALVVEVDSAGAFGRGAALDGGATRPILAVAAETVRRASP